MRARSCGSYAVNASDSEPDQAALEIPDYTFPVDNTSNWASYQRRLELISWAFLGEIKQFIMRGKIKTFLAVIFTLFLLSVSTMACVCVRDKIKAKGFSGQVFAVYESRPNVKDPMPKATLKLLKRTDDGNKISAEVTADETGYFSFENVKAGKYILEVSAPAFDKVVTEIKIVAQSSRKKDTLEIGLEPGVICCGGYAKVQNAKKS